MIKLYSQHGVISYGIIKFVVQTIEDLETLPPCEMGSTAFVEAAQTKYIKNGMGEWKPI
jgi:hypothetical protein